MPTETTAPRLIDANALIVKINSDIDGESTMAKRALVRTVTELLESSPTVETTDDVMARIRNNEPSLEYSKDFKDGKYRAYGWDRDDADASIVR